MREPSVHVVRTALRQLVKSPGGEFLPDNHRIGQVRSPCQGLSHFIRAPSARADCDKNYVLTRPSPDHSIAGDLELAKAVTVETSCELRSRCRVLDHSFTQFLYSRLREYRVLLKYRQGRFRARQPIRTKTIAHPVVTVPKKGPACGRCLDPVNGHPTTRAPRRPRGDQDCHPPLDIQFATLLPALLSLPAGFTGEPVVFAVTSLRKSAEASFWVIFASPSRPSENYRASGTWSISANPRPGGPETSLSTRPPLASLRPTASSSWGRSPCGRRPDVDSGFVFHRGDGLPYHPDFISQSFERAVKNSGQPRIRLHDVRHTHATLALRAGIHPKVVSERLGHANISITLDVYSHAIPAMEEEAAAKIAALFMPG